MTISIHPNLALVVELRRCPGCDTPIDLRKAAWHQDHPLLGPISLIVWCHVCRTVAYAKDAHTGVPYPGDGEHILSGTRLL